MNPAFKFKYIKNLFPRFWSHATQLVQSLEQEIDRASEKSSATLPTVDVDNWMMRATLDIIAAAGLVTPRAHTVVTFAHRMHK